MPKKTSPANIPVQNPDPKFVFPTKENIYQKIDDEKSRCLLCDCSFLSKNKYSHEKTQKHLRNTGKIAVGRPVDVQDLFDIKKAAELTSTEFQAHVLQSLKEVHDSVDEIMMLLEEVLCGDDDHDCVPEEDEKSTPGSCSGKNGETGPSSVVL
jgi:hypothetical protein